jgi:hypothetical protein
LVIHAAIRTVAGQSERSILLGTVLVASSASFVIGFFLSHYYSVDVLSSLIVFMPADCYLDWGLNIGRHCFSDYAIPMGSGTRANPWDPYPLYLPPDFKPAISNYPAAGMVLQVTFGLLGKLLAAPRLGLFGYLLALTFAVFTPAVWAARGARGIERVVVFVSCGVAAIPAWVVIDRGNSVGFAVPIALVFLVGLCRRRWGLVASMVVLAALVKPQFAVLAVVLFAARQWRMGSIAVAGTAVSNLAAYALWPRDFPHTITQSISGLFNYGGGWMQAAMVANSNVSFGKALLLIPDGIKAGQTGGKIPDDFLAGPRSLIGYGVLLLISSAVLALGPRIPPVMAGIALLATAALFPALSNPYYLFFVLPVAALVVRDPDGPPATGLFDRWAAVGGRRRVVGICVSLASALCIAQIALPGPSSELQQLGAHTVVVGTTVFLAPILWLIVLAVILGSYVRRPAASSGSGAVPVLREPSDAADGAPQTSERIAEFSPQPPT